MELSGQQKLVGKSPQIPTQSPETHIRTNESQITQTLHVANIITVFLRNKLRTPNNTDKIGSTIHRVKLAGFDFMQQKAMLFNVNEIINPIQEPNMNIPALGKQAKTYPAKKLQTPLTMRTFDIKLLGTPGKKTMGNYIASKIKNIEQAPRRTIEARYMYKPKTINKTPIISKVIINPSQLFLKKEKMVELSTKGHPFLVYSQLYTKVIVLLISLLFKVLTISYYILIPLLTFFYSIRETDF